MSVVFVLIPVGAVIGVLGVVGAIGNGMIASKGERPSMAWRVLGYVSGGLNFAGGVSVIAVSRGAPAGVMIGAPFAALGIGATGLTIWGQTIPDKPKGWSVAPLVPLGGTQGRAAGIGIRVASF